MNPLNLKKNRDLINTVCVRARMSIWFNGRVGGVFPHTFSNKFHCANKGYSLGFIIMESSLTWMNVPISLTKHDLVSRKQPKIFSLLGSGLVATWSGCHQDDPSSNTSRLALPCMVDDRVWPLMQSSLQYCSNLFVNDAYPLDYGCNYSQCHWFFMSLALAIYHYWAVFAKFVHFPS
jgi:hypothetical protein